MVERGYLRNRGDLASSGTCRTGRNLRPVRSAFLWSQIATLSL